ncbi:signal peptide peptidase SppA [Parvularcula sp. IMCC14364]|uniref:signal peptide peptidase SppA n=1 Tax=Parvularcula sp. IMCC14364 TaxID=3067902 RepID=UPI0027414659|nr:signal peptide peptidase SppA [Parvularcula sp. IMCC14364]
MQDENKLTIWGFLKGIVKAIIGAALLLQALLFLIFLIVFMGVITSVMTDAGSGGSGPSVAVPDGAALLLNPNGVLVEQAAESDPFEEALAEAYGSNRPAQVQVHDLTKAIRAAAEDERIDALVLDLGGLMVPSVFSSKMQLVVQEIEAFKESGKPVIAIGDYYSQEQYYIASHADDVFMHDYGAILIYGYGRYRTYYNELLTEKLNVTNHIFRVGTYKSALEPVLRNDMSEEAKEANLAYLNVLWNDYTSTVETARGLEPGTINNYANNASEVIGLADGDLAQTTVNVGLVDQLMSRKDQIDHIKGIVGEDDDEDGFKRVGYRTFLNAIEGDDDTKAPDVAIITAAGTIVDGNAPVGVAAGDRIAGYLKDAREDEDVKAVVLRVDSGGGSAFASEVMRTEVLALQEAGKPVVVSMGSLAASGGYWIAADADEIWAAPTTITGSIGIFGMIQTLENTVSQAGIYSDGVGTTDLSGVLGAGLGPLPQEFSDIMQLSIESGYERFLTIVGEARGFSRDEVDAIAQGRVWIGETAKEIGLVDQLGYFEDAIESAATLAGIQDDYDVVRLETDKTRFEIFLESLSGASVRLGLIESDDLVFGGTAGLEVSGLRRLIAEAQNEAAFYDTFNDPNAIYARCLECEPAR